MFFLCGMKNSMKEQIILILIFLLESNCVDAQWEKKDSLWLQDVLSGEEKLKLNPETMEAIKSGTFINTEKPKSLLQAAPTNKYFIYKDYSKYIKADKSDTTLRKLALKDLPASVFWLYQLPELELPSGFRNLPKYFNSGWAFDLGELTSRKTYIHKRNAAKAIFILKELNDLPSPELAAKQKAYRNSKKYASFSNTIAMDDSLYKPVRKTSMDVPERDKE